MTCWQLTGWKVSSLSCSACLCLFPVPQPLMLVCTWGRRSQVHLIPLREFLKPLNCLLPELKESLKDGMFLEGTSLQDASSALKINLNLCIRKENKKGVILSLKQHNSLLKKNKICMSSLNLKCSIKLNT